MLRKLCGREAGTARGVHWRWKLAEVYILTHRLNTLIVLCLVLVVLSNKSDPCGLFVIIFFKSKWMFYNLQQITILVCSRTLIKGNDVFRINIQNLINKWKEGKHIVQRETVINDFWLFTKSTFYQFRRPCPYLLISPATREYRLPDWVKSHDHIVSNVIVIRSLSRAHYKLRVAVNYADIVSRGPLSEQKDRPVARCWIINLVVKLLSVPLNKGLLWRTRRSKEPQWPRITF